MSSDSAKKAIPAPLRVRRWLATASLLGLAGTTAHADVTYTLHTDPASSPEAQQVAGSVAAAAAFYNQYGSFNKHWGVYYNPGIPTAEANYDGYMGFGNLRHERVVYHEGAHTFGMGTHGAYWGMTHVGAWKGKYGNRAVFESYGYSWNDTASLFADGHAVFPGGFNYDSEGGFVNQLLHIRVMAGMRADLGLLSFTREARNQATWVGQTAEFFAESPMATTWQWQKNGVNLTNGGDISGANTATLRITNAEAADAGSYRCVVTGADETLGCRPRQLWVHPSSQVGKWAFNGNANDDAGAQNGAAFGSPTYVTGKIGQAVDLDGADDYIDLPDPVGRTSGTTIATWVNWDGGGDWQRVFDFGTGMDQYLFLCPRVPGGGLRLALKDPVQGRATEYVIDSVPLPVGQWVHVAAVIGKGYMTLYVNGQAVGSVFGILSSPADFTANQNYIGKSQFPYDPNFNGRVDDFQLHARAFTGPEIWALWGQSSNQAPTFNSPLVTLPPADASTPYTGVSLASHASDPNGNPLTFAKLDGPSWLKIAADGTLSGQPRFGMGGLNSFVVRVTDSFGASSDATLEIQVTAPPAPLMFVVTSGTSAPAVNGGDVAFFPGPVEEVDTINGTTNAESNDDSTYLGKTRTSKGQTFTTGSDPAGYTLNSFSFQNVNWPTFTAPGTDYEVHRAYQWEIEIGIMNGTTKTPLLTHAAIYDGQDFRNFDTSGTGRHVTFNLSNYGLQLAPNTTHYVELGHRNGQFFELNSSRNGNYTGGTAFRGNIVGALGTEVTPLPGDFAFHVDLDPRVTPNASTVAYWNFEEGTADTYVPYPRYLTAQYEGSIRDKSGNHHHLSTWASQWAWYRPLVPVSTTPQTGAPNLLSLQNANNVPAISSIGTSLKNWSPTAWTVEAAVRPDDATAGWQTCVGRESFGSHAGNLAVSALYFGITPGGALRVTFIDAAGNFWNLESAPNTMQDGKWQAIAATSDGDTLSLYRKNLTDGDANYTLVGTLDISASTNPALSSGDKARSENFGDFCVGRGFYDWNHADRFYGHLDDIRLSNGALTPGQLLYQPSALPPSAPGSVAATTVSSSGINLSWNAVNGATSYNVKRSTTSGGSYTTVASGVTGTSFSDSGLASGTTYYYIVTAVNANGESASSAESSASTLTALPAPWTGSDIGSPAIAGTASENSGTYTVSGSGDDIWNSADSFHYVSQTLTGDGEIRAKVTSQSNTDPWAKAGVMIRDGSSAGAAHAMMILTPNNGFSFQWRDTAAANSNFVTGSATYPAPNNWVRLARSGNLFTGYASSDGINWIQQGTATITMPGSVRVGLAVTSHNNSVLSTATYQNVAITPYPSPWLTMDVGTTGLQGSAEFYNAAHTVKGAGSFGGTSDGFRYVYQTLSADGSIVARVRTLGTGTDPRVGIMMRDTFAANSRMAALTVNGSGAWRWQRRTTTGGSVTTTNSSSGTAPNLWVRLVRSGNTVTASRSTNGTSWTTIGSTTVTMASNCYIGLAVASGSTTTLNTSVMDNLTVIP